MNQNFIGPDNLPENDAIDLGAADGAAIRSAATSWRKSLKSHADGEGCVGGCCGRHSTNIGNRHGFSRVFAERPPTRRGGE